jgi:hypothetical protein
MQVREPINNTIHSRQRRSCSQDRIGSQYPKTEPLLTGTIGLTHSPKSGCGIQVDEVPYASNSLDIPLVWG